MIDYALWEVIENGATLPKIQVVEGVTTIKPITTVKEKARRRLEVEEGPNSKVSNHSTCSKSCLKIVKFLKSQNEQLVKDLKKSALMVLGNFMPPTPDLSFTGLDEFANKAVAENCKAKSSKEEPKGNPQMDLKDQGVIDSRCSRHMIGNMFYLTDYAGFSATSGQPTADHHLHSHATLHHLSTINIIIPITSPPIHQDHIITTTPPPRSSPSPTTAATIKGAFDWL
nr:hypothetical protein [Tanacetum cinerariifolium]